MAVVVITGANREIGLGLAKIYRARGDQVIACVRETSGELEAAGSEIHSGIDLREPHAIAKFANSITENTIDLLINNAATFNDRGPIDELSMIEGRLTK
ncbi:MAG: SDR family NAD(P)-dependent oxidoreductase [Hyphomicrobiales bacterium]